MLPIRLFKLFIGQTHELTRGKLLIRDNSLFLCRCGAQFRHLTLEKLFALGYMKGLAEAVEKTKPSS